MKAVWCEGRARSWVRGLTGEEVAWVERRRRGARRQFAVAIAAPVVPFVGALAVAAAASLGGPRWQASGEVVVGVLAFFAFLLGIPVAVLLVRDVVRVRARLLRDLRSGRAWDFGALSVLPHSRLVISPAERRGERTRAGVATPRPASFFAVPVDPPLTVSGARMPANQRRLSDDESAELARHANERALPWRAVLLGAICVGWIAAATKGTGGAFTGALGVVGLAWMGHRSWQALRLREAVRRDAKAGLVVTILVPSDPPSSAQRELEVLPQSGMAWTDGGVPAEWRLQAADASD